MISAIGIRNVVENQVDLTKSRNLIIAAVILVCGLGFSSGITFTVAGTSVTLTGLAIAALAGIILNAILPGKDYVFGENIKGDVNQGVAINSEMVVDKEEVEEGIETPEEETITSEEETGNIEETEMPDEENEDKSSEE